MKKFILTIFTFMIIAIGGVLPLHGQISNPVKWKFNTVKVNDSIAELQFVATIEPHWHLYAQSHKGMENPLVFEFKSSKDYKRIGNVWEPKPISFYDSIFDDTSLYFEKKVTFKQKIKVQNAEPFVVKGEFSGQACIEGRCVPIDDKFSFNVDGFENLAITVIEEDTVPAEVAQESTQQDTILKNAETETTETANEEEESMLKFFLAAFLGGLVGLLMPCVFPMIPMTVSYFVKMQEKAKLYALVFGGSIVVIFLLFGIILSAIFGPEFANMLSTHWLPNILFAIIFIIFAISLLGYFEITLPSSWVNKSAKNKSKGGIIGVFFMALTLVLVSFSCTLPIAGAVALGSADGSFLKPIIGMLGFSLGIAVPFTFFAFFPSMLKTLPKSGGWMNTLKVILAFVELAFALKFINVPDQTYHWGILDREVYLAFWIVIFSMLGFYLIGKIRFPHDDEMPVQHSWIRYMLAIFVFTFVVYLIPGMFGAPLKALSGWMPPMTTQDFDVNAIIRNEVNNGKTISLSDATQNDAGLEAPKYAETLHLPFGLKGYFDYDQALRVAKAADKPLFIDFTGHGCTNCRNVENAVWIDPRVQERFKNELILSALYVDDKIVVLDEEDQILDKDNEPITKLGKKNYFISNTKYSVNSQPTYLIVDHDGSVLAGPIAYELNVDNYLKFLDEGIAAFKKKHNKE